MKTTFSRRIKSWVAGTATPPTSASSEDLWVGTLVYGGAAPTTFVKAPLPDDAAVAVALVGDDNLLNHAALAARLQSEAGLVLGNGVGGTKRNAMTFAVNAYSNYNKTELGTSGGPTIQLSQYPGLLAAGHKLATHGAYHALSGNFFPAGVADNLAENKLYYYTKLGVVFTTVVSPNGDTAYVPVADQQGYLACLSEGAATGYTLFPREYGPAVQGLPTPNRPAPIELLGTGFTHMKRWFNDLDSADDKAFLQGLFDQAWADHSDNAHPVIPFGMHGCDPQVVVDCLAYMKSVAGNRLGILALPALLNYHQTRAKVKVAGDVVSGSKRTLKLDFSDCPVTSDEDVLTLFVGAGLQSVSFTDPTIAVAYNSATGQLNLSRRRPLTSLAGRPRQAATTTPTNLVESGPGGIPLNVYTQTWQTGTLSNEAAANLFANRTTPPTGPAINADTPSGTATTDAVAIFYPGTYVDSLDLWDSINSAAGHGTPPIEILYEVRGTNVLVALDTFKAEKGYPNGEYINFPLPRRLELARVVLRMSSPTAIWPWHVRLNGASTPRTAPVYAPSQPVRLDKKYQSNFLWNDLIKNTDPHAGVVPADFASIARFGGGRIFGQVAKVMDGNGKFYFAPSLEGGSSYDALYDAFHAVGQELLVCLNGNFVQNKGSFYKLNPQNGQMEYHETEADNAPWELGEDRLNPETYRLWGVVVNQWLIRYGYVSYPTSRSLADESYVNNYTPSNVKRTGLGRCKKLQVGNELFKGWLGADVQMTPAQAAVMYAVCLDGYKGTMGPGVGAREVDPDGLVEIILGVLVGMDAQATHLFLRALGDIYGYDSNGHVINAPRTLDVHEYSRNPLSALGTSLSLGGALPRYRAMTQILAELAPATQTIMSEYGYSYSPNADRSYVPADFGLSSPELIGSYIISTGLWLDRFGYREGFSYSFRNLQANPYAPGVPWDRSDGNENQPAQAYISQVRAVVQGGVLLDWTNDAADPTQPYSQRYLMPDGTLAVLVWADANLPFTVPAAQFGGLTSVTRHQLNATGDATTATVLAVSAQTGLSGTASPRPLIFRTGTPAPAAGIFEKQFASQFE